MTHLGRRFAGLAPSRLARSLQLPRRRMPRMTLPPLGLLCVDRVPCGAA